MATLGPIPLDRWRAGDGAWRPAAGGGWLMLGKGPSFSSYRLEEHNGRHSLGLNHIVRETPLDVAHLVDLDVVADCGPALIHNCRMLCMPRIPNVGARPGSRALDELLPDQPTLARLAGEGRLVWYNTTTTPTAPGSPRLPIGSFSSVTALALLAELGATDVQSLGIDGGRNYSGAFEDLAESTRLQNGQQLFDAQFHEIRSVAERYGICFRPIGSPVRIGPTDRLHAVVDAVLQYSIRHHTSRRLEWVGPDGEADIRVPPGVGLVTGDVSTGVLPGPRPVEEIWWQLPEPTPWRAPARREAAPWIQAYAEAIHAGLVRPADVRAGVRNGTLDADLLKLPMTGPGVPPAWSADGQRVRLQRELANLKLSLSWSLGRHLVGMGRRLLGN